MRLQKEKAAWLINYCYAIAEMRWLYGHLVNTQALSVLRIKQEEMWAGEMAQRAETLAVQASTRT